MINLIRLSLIVGIGISSCKGPVHKPNIILIMTDDQGWYDAGFNGNTDIKTPCIDSLASNGIVFDRFYSASAVCSPTRASLITGRNPLRMNIPYANNGHMKDEEITIPEILKKEGYATGHFGKWHLGSKVPTLDPMVYPTTFIEGESKQYGWRAVKNFDSIKSYGTAYWKGVDQKDTNNLKGDDSHVIMDRVIPFIENSLKEDRPFFTTIWFHTPHLPVVSDSIHRSYYSEMDLAKQIYYGTITAMDEQVGRLWEKLEESGIQEETIIFFCSDNGPEVRTPGSTGVFRERKRSLYEGGVRVPAFVIWKNNLEGGRRIDFPAVTSDYMPTILDILDIEYPDERPVDGISILGALKGSEKERIKPIGFICEPQVSWVTNQYKLIGDEKGENFELYDLLNDKSEKENIIKEYPEIAEKLKADLLLWLNSIKNSKKGMDYN
jgi:arylsulfatase A-like enzyme